MIEQKKPTLCWDCRKPGTGECSWDQKLEPVEGWDAEQTVLFVGYKYVPSYCVYECHLFEEDRRTMSGPSAVVAQDVRDRVLALFQDGATNEQISKIIGLPRRVVRYHKQRFNKMGLLG